MLRTLLKLRFASFFASLFAGKKKRRGIPMVILLGLLILLLAASLLFGFVGIFIGMGAPLLTVGATDIYLAVGGGACLLLMLFGSVIYTKNQLYVENDHELLLAMPIPPHLILTSKLILLLAVNFLFEALAALPMLLVFFLFGAPTAGSIVFTLLALLLLPVISLALSSLLAYLLALLSARIKQKALLTTLLTVLFLVVYFAFTFGLGGVMESLLIDVTPFVNAMRSVPPLAVLGRAMCGSLLDFAIFFLPALILTALIFYRLSRTYLRTVLEKRGAKKEIYRETAVRRRSPLLALILRELRHLVSSAGYMVNAGMGILFVVALPIVLLVESGTLAEIVAADPTIAAILPAAFVATLFIMLSMIFFSACAVSLEGRSLWIIRTSPVSTRIILASKVLFHTVIAAPAGALGGLLTAIALRASLPLALLLILTPAAFAHLLALLGLTFNLLFPKLEWKNELVPIKQGGAVALAMLGGAFVAILFGGVGILLSLFLSPALALLLTTLLILSASVGLVAFLSRGGVRLFEAL